MIPGLMLGAALIFGALFLAIAALLFPAARRVPASRRRAPGADEVRTLTKVADRTMSAVDRVMRRRTPVSVSAATLESAGITATPSAVLVLVGCAAVVLAASAVLIAGLSGWGVVLAILSASLAPLGAKLLLLILAKRRREKFADQLDDTLTLLAGGLKAGHSLLRVLDSVSQETESPTSDEFARVVNETRLGRDLSGALADTAGRMRSRDFEWVAQAIAINREAGGNLSEVFEQIAATIRERNQIRRQVKALSAEGKLSALVLILLPVAVFGFLLTTQPTYFSGFFSSLLGVIALGVAAVLLILGSLWMMVAVRVKF